MNFFYVYFSTKSLEQLRMLVLSVMTVRHFYSQSEIIVIDYSEDKRLDRFSEELNFKVVRKQPHYAGKNNLVNKMVSKPMDCILLAQEMKLKNIALIDSDIFFTNKFSPIDFEKFSIFHHEKTSYNSGILFFSPETEAIEVFKQLYDFSVQRCHESLRFVHYCLSLFERPLRNKINEEVLIGSILETLPFFKEKHCSNICIENHGHLEFFLNRKDLEFNNLHFLCYGL